MKSLCKEPRHLFSRVTPLSCMYQQKINGLLFYKDISFHTLSHTNTLRNRRFFHCGINFNLFQITNNCFDQGQSEKLKIKWKDTMKQTSFLKEVTKLNEVLEYNKTNYYNSEFDQTKTSEIDQENQRNGENSLQDGSLYDDDDDGNDCGNVQKTIQIENIQNIVNDCEEIVTAFQSAKLSKLQVQLIQTTAKFLLNYYENDYLIEKDILLSQNDEDAGLTQSLYLSHLPEYLDRVSERKKQGVNDPLMVAGELIDMACNSSNLLVRSPMVLIYSLSLAIQIAMKRQDTKKLALYFDLFVPQVTKIFQSSSQDEIPIHHLIAPFTAAPHLHKWKEMEIIGNFIKKCISSKASKVRAISRRNNEDDEDDESPVEESFFDIFHQQAVRYPMQVFDYSMIYDIVLNGEAPVIPKKYDPKAYPLLHHQSMTSYAVYDMKLIQTKTTYSIFTDDDEEIINEESVDTINPGVLNDPSQCYAEKEEENEETKWHKVTDDLPKLIRWGGALLWFQQNGEIALSGTIDPQFKKIYLRGYDSLENIKPESPESFIDEFPLEDREKTLQELKKPLEGMSNPEYANKLIQTEYTLDNTGTIDGSGVIFRGKHIRTVHVHQSNNINIVSSHFFDIVLTIAEYDEEMK